jgi:regulatory protein
VKIRIEADSEQKDIFTLFVEEEPWAQFHRRIFGRHPKFSAKTLPELCEEFVEKEWTQARNFALKSLARKSYHSQELKKLLAESLVNEAIIDEVVCECKELGYLDDNDMLLRLLQRNQAQKDGPHKILWKIRRKGIVDEQFEEKLEESYPPAEQMEQIKRLLQTRYRSKDLTCPKEKQKVAAALSRKGFSYEVIRQVLG